MPICHNTCILAQMMARYWYWKTISDDGKYHQLSRLSAAAITKVCKILTINDLLTNIDVADFLHWPINNLVDDDWWCIEIMPAYLFHNILNSHYSMAAMKMKAVLPPITQQQVLRVIIVVFFFKTFLADYSWSFRRKKNLIISVRPLLTPEHGRGGSPDQRNSQVIFTKL